MKRIFYYADSVSWVLFSCLVAVLLFGGLSVALRAFEFLIRFPHLALAGLSAAVTVAIGAVLISSSVWFMLGWWPGARRV